MSAWIQHIKAHKGQGYTLKDLSDMYHQRGGANHDDAQIQLSYEAEEFDGQVFLEIKYRGVSVSISFNNETPNTFRPNDIETVSDPEFWHSFIRKRRSIKKDNEGELCCENEYLVIRSDTYSHENITTNIKIPITENIKNIFRQFADSM